MRQCFPQLRLRDVDVYGVGVKMDRFSLLLRWAVCLQGTADTLTFLDGVIFEAKMESGTGFLSCLYQYHVPNGTKKVSSRKNLSVNFRRSLISHAAMKNRIGKDRYLPYVFQTRRRFY